ncbi:porin family protein [Petrachloros mirabilis]
MFHSVSVYFLHPFHLLCLSVVLLSPCQSQAESYVGGMFGYTAPNDLTDVKLAGNSSISFSDLALQNSLAYGAKVGYFFPQIKWLGVETEFYNTTPHVKQQDITVSGFGVSVPTGTQPGFNLRVLTWGINAIVRYPGKVLQPYAGVGLGVMFAEAKFQGQSDSDTAPGLNALAGIRFFATEHLALFAEYKYNRASFNLPNAIGIDADYSANHFMGGVSFHF